MSDQAETTQQNAFSRTGRYRRRVRKKTSLVAHGEPMVWLSGGALMTALGMIAALIATVLYFGGRTFWPQPVELYQTEAGGSYMGELSRTETREQDGEELTRHLLRVGNRDLTGVSYRWIEDAEISEVTAPEWALTVERRAWNRLRACSWMRASNSRATVRRTSR